MIVEDFSFVLVFDISAHLVSPTKVEVNPKVFVQNLSPHFNFAER